MVFARLRLAARNLRAHARDALARARRRDGHGASRARADGHLDRQRLRRGEQQVAARDGGKLDLVALDAMARLVEPRERGARRERREVDEVVARLDAQRHRELRGLGREREVEPHHRALRLLELAQIEQIGRGQARGRLGRRGLGADAHDRAVGGDLDRDVALAHRARPRPAPRASAEPSGTRNSGTGASAPCSSCGSTSGRIACGTTSPARVEHAQVGEVGPDRAAVDRDVEQQGLERVRCSASRPRVPRRSRSARAARRPRARARERARARPRSRRAPAFISAHLLRAAAAGSPSPSAHRGRHRREISHHEQQRAHDEERGDLRARGERGEIDQRRASRP